MTMVIKLHLMAATRNVPEMTYQRKATFESSETVTELDALRFGTMAPGVAFVTMIGPLLMLAV